jgi:hypothetical protein
MISVPHPVRVCLHTPATYPGKGFHSLSGLVTSAFAQDPTSGHLFCSLIHAAIDSRFSTGIVTALRSGTRSTSKTTPILLPLQNLAETPIISLTGLMRLAE